MRLSLAKTCHYGVSPITRPSTTHERFSSSSIRRFEIPDALHLGVRQMGDGKARLSVVADNRVRVMPMVNAGHVIKNNPRSIPFIHSLSRRNAMDTTFDSSQTELRAAKQRIKSDVVDAARGISGTVSDEFKNFVADVEDVVKRVAHANDADVARVRDRIQDAISSTKNGLSYSAANLKRQAQDAAKYADEYVHDSPWQAIGVGAALAAVFGLSIGYLTARR
jgi:ElaB/YqjD/DUF883 family membrane-anchored ribosome-binding protein